MQNNGMLLEICINNRQIGTYFYWPILQLVLGWETLPVSVLYLTVVIKDGMDWLMSLQVVLDYKDINIDFFWPIKQSSFLFIV